MSVRNIFSITMSKFLILLLLLSSTFQFGKFQEITVIKDVIELMEKFNTVSNTKNNMGEIFKAIVDGTSEESRQIQQSLSAIKDTFTYLKNFITNRFQDVQDDIRILPLKRQIQRLEKEFSQHTQTINAAVKVIRKISKETGGVSDSRLHALVDDHYDKVLGAVENMQKHLAPPDDERETKSLAELYGRLTTEDILHRCGTGNSPQQLLMGLYVDLIKTETNAMEVLTFLTSLQKPGDHVWVRLTRQFVGRYNAHINSLVRALRKAVQEHRSCDPDPKVDWKRNTTFFELEKFHQTTTFHRTGSSERREKFPNCSDWFNDVLAKQTFPEGACQSSESEACWFSPPEICKGTLHDCLAPTAITTCTNNSSFLPPTATQWGICVWHRMHWYYNPFVTPYLIENELKNMDSSTQNVSSRRYSWMQNRASSEFYGNADFGCNHDGTSLNEGYGDTCVCHCIEGHNKISLDLIFSDTYTNRVITGMRFAQKDNIIFIQIKEGILQPHGRIANESTSWKPSSPNQDPDKLLVLNAQNQGINLDYIKTWEDRVLPGIRFSEVRGSFNKRLRLELRMTDFNYTEGKLVGSSGILTATDENRFRDNVDINNPTVNLLENVPTTSMERRWLNFERSSLTSDAGQTTLPLFDAVPVEGQPASPLAGAGIFYKKVPNFGGFLSLRAIVIDVSKYFEENVKPVPEWPLTDPGKSFKYLIRDILSAL